MSTLREQNGHPFDYQDPLSGRGVITRRRTPEAQADIAAARGVPIEAEIEAQNLDAALSNAALAGTPAVREMGGPVEVKRTTSGCKACDALGYQLDNGHALILRGPEAERYRALQAAARAAQETGRAAQAASVALRDAIQKVCEGLATGKEG